MSDGDNGQNQPHTISTIVPVPPILSCLTERERDLILALRSIDFFRAGRQRLVLLQWNGVRLVPFDTLQIR